MSIHGENNRPVSQRPNGEEMKKHRLSLQSDTGHLRPSFSYVRPPWPVSHPSLVDRRSIGSLLSSISLHYEEEIREITINEKKLVMAMENSLLEDKGARKLILDAIFVQRLENVKEGSILCSEEKHQLSPEDVL